MERVRPGASALAGKVALVTGGSRGIGAEIVLALARGGADVAFTDKSSVDLARKVASSAREHGVRTLALPASEGERKDSTKALEEIPHDAHMPAWARVVPATAVADFLIIDNDGSSSLGRASASSTIFRSSSPAGSTLEISPTALPARIGAVPASLAWMAAVTWALSASDLATTSASRPCHSPV